MDFSRLRSPRTPTAANQKGGHGGTLDPLATGVLPIAVGRATRLLQYLPERKAYRAVIRFGVTTTTDDLEGEVAAEQPATHLQRSDVEAVLPQFLGTLNQTPPMYSAIQVDGKRLYDLARKGKTVEVPTRQVTIYQLMLREWQSVQYPARYPAQYPELTIDVDCGAGTYIRALARDIGAAVGTGATLAQLTRTHSSGFDLAGSITLENLEQAIAQKTFDPCAAIDAVRHLQAVVLSPALSLRWRMGQKIALTEDGIEGLIEAQRFTNFQVASEAALAPVRVMDASTEAFLGIGEIRTVPTITKAIPESIPESIPEAALEVVTSATSGPLPAMGNILVPKMVFLPV